MAAACPMPGLAIHSSTKIFTSYLAQTLNYELRSQADVLYYQPYKVHTKEVGNLADSFTISTERAANVCFRDLGSTSLTNGSLRHEIQKYIAIMTPSLYSYPLIYNIMDKHIDEINEKE